MKRTNLVLLAAILLAIFPSLAQAAAVGKFTHVEGRVDVIPPAQPARAATLGDEVSIGDTLRTKSQSKAEVTFNDGNVLRIAERTAMVISEYMVDQESMSGTLKLSRGKIQNIVKITGGRLFGRDKKDRFEVHTPTAIVGVRGTDFFTYHTRGISGALFQEGKGYGYSANRPEEVKDISAGQAMVVVSADQVPVIKPATDVEIKLHINDTAPSKKDETKDQGKTGEPTSGLGSDKDAALASATTGDTSPATTPKSQKTTPPSPSQTTSPGQSQTNPTVVPFTETVGRVTQQVTPPVTVSSSVNGSWAGGTLYYNDSGKFAQAGSDSGLIGGLTAPWNSPTSPFSAMGSYALSETAPAGTYLWNAGITGWDPGNTGFKSDEGNDTGFTGFTAGFWKAPTTTYGTVDGAASAIYMTSGGAAGLLTSSNLSGYHFPGLGMWMVDGTLARKVKPTVPNPSDYEIYDGEITGSLSGSFGSSSSILGEIDSGITRFFKDMNDASPTYHTSLPWGIYRIKFGSDSNTYTAKPSGLASWSSTAGGQGLFGYYLGAGDSGYWLAGITGTWSDAGELRGSLTGAYLTPSHTGTLAGPFTGINSAASGTWIGQSIGTFEGQALLFNGETSNGKLLHF
ncbi:MAG: FecR domain-containing protein, partial [Deltaproteobacteria bacterium]|nr:FecR domain-containing protein [Deltaproteobacteria bacterium]